uniref:HECT, C2 and WW domain containing E3 ubiquitin protein ligase 1 n=1 Tax=Scleropages formosus TaxID=113540 RepID=A0A8C9U3T5_SCLFO
MYRAPQQPPSYFSSSTSPSGPCFGALGARPAVPPKRLRRGGADCSPLAAAARLRGEEGGGEAKEGRAAADDAAIGSCAFWTSRWLRSRAGHGLHAHCDLGARDTRMIHRQVILSQNLYQNRFLGLAAMASPSRSSQGRRRCKDPIRHSYNPEQFQNVDLQNCGPEGPPVARSTSDTDLVTSQGRSALTVSSSFYTVGQPQDLVICWDIKEEVDAGDWIGMYLIDEVLSENFLDYKNRGVNGSHKGQIVWKIEASSYFVESETKVCFKYYHGLSGALRATTPSVTVKNPSAPVFKPIATEEVTQSQGSRRLISFSLSDFQAVGLKKGMFFNPDPYLKIAIHPGKHSIFPALPHHGQEKRSSIVCNTINPVWQREVLFSQDDKNLIERKRLGLELWS